MPLTPADVHNMAFKKPPIGKRGYDEEEVDGFLDAVEQELIRLLEENRELQDEIVRQPPGGGPVASTMVLDGEFADVAAKLDRMQQARARAEQEARMLQAELEQARNAVGSRSAGPGDDDRNAPVLMMAQRTADDHLRDARQESDALLSEARQKAGQITREAERKAGTIEGDARRHHAESMNSLGAKRDALLDDIKRLGEFAQGYQAALESHVTQQMQDLDGAPAA